LQGARCSHQKLDAVRWKLSYIRRNLYEVSQKRGGYVFFLMGYAQLSNSVAEQYIEENELR